MIYRSTRSDLFVSAPKAILEGLAADGGLFVPTSLPTLSPDQIRSGDFYAIAREVLFALFPDFGEKKIAELVEKAYRGKFSSPEITPLIKVGDEYILELFHGPTAAFKDVALSMLPHLIVASREALGVTEEIVILTATSGDTGKAALVGFQDVPGTKIAVFYPEGGVSAVQRAQMVTQEGKNVTAAAVIGNFDDAQSGVKELFSRYEKENDPQKTGVRYSSANSINIARLAPQIIYYFKAYADLWNAGAIQWGDKVNFTVPTGNFGDILAGFLAGRMGLPLGKLVCASNKNDVLTEFLLTGRYDRKREFYKTDSPSMDILVSSNLERLLYYMTENCETVAGFMNSLKENGEYQVDEKTLSRIQEQFAAFSASDEAGREKIAFVYNQYGYLMDPHTAVAYAAARRYKETVTEPRPMVILSTASPYKFPEAVLSALGKKPEGDGFLMQEELCSLTGVQIPAPLCGLKGKKERHRHLTTKENMGRFVEHFLSGTKKRAVSVKTPATSANLGPGFDAFGLAWNLFYEAQFVLTPGGFAVEGYERGGAPENNLALRAFRSVFDEAGIELSGVTVREKSEIPSCRGLGSSAAVIAAGVVAANAFLPAPFSLEKLLEIGTKIEGHPDNLAPALYGGLCASVMEEDLIRTVRVLPHEKFTFAAIVPPAPLSTAKARSVLPSSVPFRDAVYNLSRAAALFAAFQSGDEQTVATAMKDRLHQPYRKELIEGFDRVESLARAAGALGFCISGAGSTMLAVGTGEAWRDRLNDQIRSVCPEMRVLCLRVNEKGALVTGKILDE